MKPVPFFILFALAACTTDVDPSFTKAEVRAMEDPDVDYCDLYGWYGDGECDDFCLTADSDCGGCVVTGCSSQLCADGPMASTCEWLDEYACYQDHGVCERQADGLCGWTDTPELTECLDDPTPEPECVITGCSSHVCAAEPMATTCEFLPEYACYQEHGECARQADGLCGWTDTPDLAACLLDPDPEPEPECIATGCSGQLCADMPIDTTCEFLPEYACYQELGMCERQADGACGWSDTPELAACLADPEPEPEPEPECLITGCSGQVCADMPVITTCEARPEYVCYTRHGVCEGQTDGVCGWTESPELLDCLADFGL